MDIQLDLTPSERDELLLALDLRWVDLDRFRQVADLADEQHWLRKQELITAVMTKLKEAK